MILNIIAFEIQKPNSPGTGHQTNNWIILKIRNFLKEADARYSEIYMVGDLNCTSNIDYSRSDPPEVHTTHLLDFVVDYQLAQLIKDPTGVNAKSQTLIDVFITNKKDNISHSGVYIYICFPLAIAILIYAVRKIGLPREQPKFIQSINFKHFNEENFLTDLENASWPDIYEG